MIYRVSYTTLADDDGSTQTDRMLVGASSANEARKVAEDWLDEARFEDIVSIVVDPA